MTKAYFTVTFKTFTLQLVILELGMHENFSFGSIWTGLWTWTVQMTSAFDMSDSSSSSSDSSSSDSSLLTYTCARDLKFSPDPDQTKTRPKLEKKFVRVKLVQVLYGSTWNLTLTYTCARDLKFSPDPDQTKTRLKPEIFLGGSTWTCTGTLWFDFKPNLTYTF